MNLESADFDVTITGFEIAEVDAVIAELRTRARTTCRARLRREAITEPGDLWKSASIESCAATPCTKDIRNPDGNQRAAACSLIRPSTCGLMATLPETGNPTSRVRHGIRRDERSEFVSFLINAIDLLAAYSREAIAYICIDWRHMEDLIRAGKQTYDEFANLCVWVKDNGGMGSFYRSQHEFIVVFRKGKDPIGTTSNSVSSAGTELTSGSIRVFRRCPIRAGKATSLRFIQR